MYNKKEWENPSDKYRVNNNSHKIPKDKKKYFALLKEYGFSGVLTNVPFDNGFTKNKDNIKELQEIVKAVNDNQMEYWLYDEKEYPSGTCNGEVNFGRKDLNAKVVYLRKYESFYQPLSFNYRIDGLSDKIAFAVKYKVEYSDSECEILLDTFQLVPHEKTDINVDLQPFEVIYIYIVKDAYEGCPATHSIKSRLHYINLLNKEATDRFLEMSYKRIADFDKSIFKNAKAVFTDEPSLESIFVRSYRVNNYAPIPYEDTLIDAFNNVHGYDLKKYFFLLFEDYGTEYPSIRVDFYRFIAETVAKNYITKLNDFCVQNGTLFSGHYFGEEKLVEHVMCYGNLFTILMATGYAGMDAIQCTPEENFYYVPKYLETVARKKKQDGYMVEFCPFCNIEVFERNPFENAIGTMSVLAMFNARKINTYYRPDFSQYFTGEDKQCVTGRMNREQAIYFSTYFARICSLLENCTAVYENYIYYAIEDVQAKFRPKICADYRRDMYLSSYDISVHKMVEFLRKGISYTFFDEDELMNGIPAKRIIIPEIHFISDNTAKLLISAKQNGTEIYFVKNIPKTIFGKSLDEFFTKIDYEELYAILSRDENCFGVEFAKKDVIAQSYGKYYAVYNNNKNDIEVGFSKTVTAFNPDDASVIKYKKGDKTFIKSYRVMLFEKCE